MNLSNIRIGIGLPCNWTHIPFTTALNLLLLDKTDCILLPSVNGHISEMRNRIVSEAFDMGCTHVVMMDLDQTYPKDTITRLMAHKKLVVGAYLNRRLPPFDPMLFEGESGAYRPTDGYEDGDLVEVDATGTGCILYDMRVFRETSYPWFNFSRDTDDHPIGEDFGFCAVLRDRGIPIYVDTSIECGHLALFEVNKSTRNVYLALARNKGD